MCQDIVRTFHVLVGHLEMLRVCRKESVIKGAWTGESDRPRLQVAVQM